MSRIINRLGVAIMTVVAAYALVIAIDGLLFGVEGPRSLALCTMLAGLVLAVPSAVAAALREARE